ncbi:hypothetical protein J2Z83_001804 [Virgibacillus natechei]|uniref:DUF2627 domain-containing protein n=1 Tax=Virgibacillus natechei TaxID=1216297 RepID=A0ABS4IFH4_9BACI|nr:DUF2627 family protein [Virgibacillus natechei]MBP1969697.1 hypothetical protein [Virgibacillus natechei]UZD11422.1 DUF2627 domain-containing protein [Virgibacillus natechei]
MVRIIAVLLLFIPGIVAAYGIKLMRDTLFNEFNPIFFHTGIQFFLGFIFFLGGLGFIGGFIVYRDKKRQRTKKQNKKAD